MILDCYWDDMKSKIIEYTTGTGDVDFYGFSLLLIVVSDISNQEIKCIVEY